MRRLIVSDLHANGEALEAVLRSARGGYDEAVCCGDVVGYGAAPGETIAWAREHAAVIVRGNHDKVCGGLSEDAWFNAAAREAAQWTRATLTADDLEWLRGLPAGPVRLDTYEVAHGAPFDEDEYLVDDIDVEDLDHALERPICFVGHTHLQCGWQWTRGGLYRLPVPAGHEEERLVRLEPETLYLVNPGSVGQPRDRDPRAAYAIWDDESGLLVFRRVPYDIERAQRRMREAGLPAWLSDRLSAGR